MWRKFLANISRPELSLTRKSVRFFHRYERSGLQQSDLVEINSKSTPLERAQEAIKKNLYALAVLLITTPDVDASSDQFSGKIPLETQSQLIRGLARYHPRLTPVNLMALRRLSQTKSFEMQSIEKALLIETLIRYGDQQLFLQGLEIAHSIHNGPIPVSAIMRAVEFAYQSEHLESCRLLWHYLQQHYLLQLADYTSLMIHLMKTFARAKDYKELAREVADFCLTNVDNPGIALSIAKVAYRLRDRDLVKALLESQNFTLSREVRGALVQLESALGHSVIPPSSRSVTEPLLNSDELTEQEFSGVVKGLAAQNIERAHLLVEQNGDGSNVLANIALANQLIAEKDFARFQNKMTELSKAKAVPGIMLNLSLKWEQAHGTFYKAKRYYQNWRHVPHRQRVIALNTLSQMARETNEKEWVRNERKVLAAVRLKND